MQKITRTIYGAELQLCNLLNNPLIIPANSTLNQKWNLNDSYTLNPGQVPSIKYLCIGQGGHQLIVGANNQSYFQGVQHTARQAALYDHLPFIIRPLANDLSAPDRAKYRMRVIQNIGGTVYVMYYLRVLDLSATQVTLNYNTVTNGVTTTTSFTPTLSDLNPTAPPLSNTGQNITTGDYLSANAIINLELSQDDINELLNVCTILNGDANISLISELGLCSGLDATVNGNFSSGTATYTDAVAVQLTDIINVLIPAMYSNGENITFNVSNVGPLFSITV